VKVKSNAAAAPLIGASTCALLFACYYFSLLRSRSASLDQCSFTLEQGTVLWGSTSLVLDLSMLWSIIIGSWIIAGRLRRLRTRRRRWLAFMLSTDVLLCVALSVWRVGGSGSGVRLHKVPEKIPLVDLILRITNVTAASAIVALLFATYFISQGASRCSPAELSRRLRLFRHVLYSAAVLLGVGVYQIFRLYQWGALLHGLEAEKAWLLEFAYSIAMGGGIAFSWLLVLMFLPSALLLSDALESVASDAARRTDGSLDREKWLIQHRLETAPLRAVGSYVAVLLPALTGFVTNLANLGRSS